MIVATVLTLFFVPYLYAQLDDLRASGARWFAYVVGKRAAADDGPAKIS
jgi:hypothetical protein